MRRKAFIGILLATLSVPFLFPLSAESAYYGSSKSNKYLYASCYWTKKIHVVNLVVFKDNEEAKRAGYIPCKVCRP